MVLNIDNASAKESINACSAELVKIEHLIEGMGSTATPVPYLIRYSLIKVCGTIEFSFKTIICDHKYASHSSQIQNFIDEKFRHSSMNPSYEKICGALKSFDIEWNKKFKGKIASHPENSKLLDSLKSLNAARNTFAHGSNPTASFANVRDYFNHSVQILEMMEASILESETEEDDVNENEPAETTIPDTPTELVNLIAELDQTAISNSTVPIATSELITSINGSADHSNTA